MTNSLKIALSVSLLLALAACAAPTPYKAAGQGYGYDETQIEDNRFRVSFSGNSLTDRETVENYLLYRAAELTLENGYDHFIVSTQDTEKDTWYRSSFDGFYGHGFYHHSFDHFGHRHGVGLGGGYDLRPVERYAAYAEIIMVEGDKDSSDSSAFDAEQVIDNLGPGVVRPQQ